jgi:FAD synthetase
MDSVFHIPQIEQLANSLTGKKIVLVGGCFDILHPGHFKFLENAKKHGQILVVLLESDQRIKHLKGKSRPFFSQSERAQMLISLRSVDFVVMLPDKMMESDYDSLVTRIKPLVIAVSKNDPTLEFKKRSAQLVGAHVISVIDFIPGISSSNILKKILE